jgi:prepilin-type N-terminal cleavage/methylation domain-containing protein
MHSRARKGFTLIEIILLLVVAGIAAAAVAQFSFTSTARSTQNVALFQDENTMRNDMEAIVIHYKDLIAQGTMTLPTMLAWVNANYAAKLDAAKTGYLTFAPSADPKVYDPSAVSAAYAANVSLLVTLTRGDQTLSELFTE